MVVCSMTDSTLLARLDAIVVLCKLRRPVVTFATLDDIYTRRVGHMQMNRGEWYEAAKELVDVVGE